MKRKKQKRQSKRGSSCRLPLAVLMLCLSVFLFSAFFFLRDFLRYRQEDQSNISLTEEVWQARDKADEDIFNKYAALWEKITILPDGCSLKAQR